MKLKDRNFGSFGQRMGIVHKNDVSKAVGKALCLPDN